jgi:hypothetical protein
MSITNQIGLSDPQNDVEDPLATHVSPGFLDLAF